MFSLVVQYVGLLLKFIVLSIVELLQVSCSTKTSLNYKYNIFLVFNFLLFPPKHFFLTLFSFNLFMHIEHSNIVDLVNIVS